MTTGEHNADPLAPARFAGNVLAKWIQDNPAFLASGLLVLLAAFRALHAASYDQELALVLVHEVEVARLLVAAVVSFLPFAFFLVCAFAVVKVSMPSPRRFTYALVLAVAGCGVLLTAPTFMVVAALVTLGLSAWTSRHEADGGEIGHNWVAAPFLLLTMICWLIVTAPLLPTEEVRLKDGTVVTGGTLGEDSDTLKLITVTGPRSIRLAQVRDRRLCPRPWYEEPVHRLLDTRRQDCR